MTQALDYGTLPRVVTSNGIGARIREAREGAGLRRLELAANTGLSLNTIRNYEENLTAPSVESLRLISEATSVDLLWLIDGERVGEVA